MQKLEKVCLVYSTDFSYEHFSNALISINKWLLEIPADERTEEVLDTPDGRH